MRNYPQLPRYLSPQEFLLRCKILTLTEFILHSDKHMSYHCCWGTWTSCSLISWFSWCPFRIKLLVISPRMGACGEDESVNVFQDYIRILGYVSSVLKSGRWKLNSWWSVIARIVNIFFKMKKEPSLQAHNYFPVSGVYCIVHEKRLHLK